MTSPDIDTQRSPNNAITTIEIHKEYLHFSCAHFTLFSSTDRENLHGHNFQIGCEATAEVDDTGLCFDYNILKTALKSLCADIDEQMLLPGLSPWLQVEQTEAMVFALFNGERIPFLPRDVTVLPVRNITVEELAGWALEQLLNEPAVKALPIKHLLVRVASGNDQWARSDWSSHQPDPTPGTNPGEKKEI